MVDILEEDFKEEFLAKYRAHAQEDLENNNVPTTKKNFMLYDQMMRWMMCYAWLITLCVAI